MNDMMEVLVHNHNHWLIAIAASVCVIGSCLTVLLSIRLIQSRNRGRHIQLVLTSIIAGATIWSTHFIAMLAYEPGVNHGYDLQITIISLGVAVLGMFLSNVILASGPRYPHFLFSGATFGLTVAMMHYLGMAAYLLPGLLVWDMAMLMLSISFGVIFGAIAHHRIAYPVTRYCWMAGAFFMVVAICMMHFTGMGAFEIVVDTNLKAPQQVIPDQTLAMLIMTVTAVILFVGFASASIETNITHEAQNRLKFAALHDPMTSLPNRMLLDQEMDTVAQHLDTNETEKVAVLTIDLNLFKEINDLYGHATGDTVLKTIATRISDALQPGEFIARAGGDEFVAIKRNFRRLDEVIAFAERIHALIVEPIDIHFATTTVGAAIGVATSLHDSRDVRDLLHKSDLAMYRAKAEPEAHICMFNAEMDLQSQDRLLLIKDLREATANGEFELAYQFQNDMTSSDVIGFEALLRWNHPTRGRVSPGEFIPLAEETGLIREIGLWVMRTACIEATQWSNAYSIAVNVAPQQLVQPSFLDHVSEILSQSGLDPNRLELEITEASIIDDQVHTLKVMHKLQDMGIRIAMDDFGTGYSSLAMLQAFPFDKIKIDRSFIQDVHKNDQRAAIVRATLLLADAFQIPVLAEGVEHLDELEFLRLNKCNAVQGFYFGKPMNVQQLHASMHVQVQKKAS